MFRLENVLQRSGSGERQYSSRSKQTEAWIEQTNKWEKELEGTKGFSLDPYNYWLDLLETLDAVQKDFLKAMVEIMVLRLETYQQFFRSRQSQQDFQGSLTRVLIADMVARGDPDWLKGGPQRAIRKPYFSSPGLASAPQMAALLLDVYNDEKRAFRTLRVLTALMAPYYKNDFLQIKNDTLLLTTYIYDEEIDLVNYLNGKTENNILIDLIDISDIVRTWIQGIFAHHFKPVFVEIVLDMFLQKGPSVLIAFVYGILATFKDEIIEEKDEAGFYSRIWTLPSKSDDQKKINMILKKFNELYLKVSKKAGSNDNWVESQREKKDWNLLLKLKEQLTITKQSGDRDWASKRLERANAVKKRLDLQKEVELFEKIDKRSQRLQGDDDEDCSDEQAEKRVAALVKKVTRLQEVETKNIEEIDFLRAKLKQVKPLNRHSRVQRQGITPFKMDEMKFDEHILKKSSSKALQTTPKRYAFWNKSYKETMQSVRGPCVYMQGRLWKISRRTNERWFVLKDHYLTYYKSAMNTTPQRDRYLDMRGHIITACSRGRGEFSLEIAKATPDGTPVREKHRLLLSVREKSPRVSEQIRNMWLTALRSAAARPRFVLSVELDRALKHNQKKKDGHNLKFLSRKKGAMHTRHSSQQIMMKDALALSKKAARANTHHIRQRSGNPPMTELGLKRASPSKSLTRIDRRTRSHSGNSLIAGFSRESAGQQKGVPFILKSNMSRI